MSVKNSAALPGMGNKLVAPSSPYTCMTPATMRKVCGDGGMGVYCMAASAGNTSLGTAASGSVRRFSGSNAGLNSHLARSSMHSCSMPHTSSCSSVSAASGVMTRL